LKASSRLQWADILKGLGITAVVIGHLFSGIIHDILYIFHLPLFFLISAFFFKKNSDLKGYFIRQSKRLLLPYLVYLTIFFLIFHWQDLVDQGNTFATFKLIGKAFIGGRALVSPFSVFWFITVLFATQQLFNLMLNKLSKRRCLQIGLLSYLLALINDIFLPNFWLPWNINVVLGTLPFFVLGYFFNSKVKSLKDSHIFLIGAFALLSAYFIPNNTLDLKYSVYGVPFLSLFSSIAIVIFLKRVSEGLGQFKLTSVIFAEIGKASLVIMYLHVPIQALYLMFFDRNVMLMLLFPILLSLLVYELAKKSKLSKKLLLGS